MSEKQEAKFNIDGQWFYRGNRSPMWLLVASRPDGSCQDGISEKVPEDLWPLLEEIARLKDSHESAWKAGYDVGHSDGLGCGHDQAPMCRHDSDKEWLTSDYRDAIREQGDSASSEGTR